MFILFWNTKHLNLTKIQMLLLSLLETQKGIQPVRLLYAHDESLFSDPIPIHGVLPKPQLCRRIEKDWRSRSPFKTTTHQVQLIGPQQLEVVLIRKFHHTGKKKMPLDSRAS